MGLLAVAAAPPAAAGSSGAAPAADLLQVNVSPYSVGAFARARHDHELQVREALAGGAACRASHVEASCRLLR